MTEAIGGGWVTPEEAASLRAAAAEFYRLDRLACANLDYYVARLAAARVLAGRVEELIEALRQQRATPAGGTDADGRERPRPGALDSGGL